MMIIAKICTCIRRTFAYTFKHSISLSEKGTDLLSSQTTKLNFFHNRSEKFTHFKMA